MPQEGFKYYAFISYSHRDQKIAKRLQRRLESYHLPSALSKAHPDLPKNLRPIFIDESYLVARGTLKTALQSFLDESNYLILICSPSSAKSEYVNDEVDYFIKHGKVDRIIPLIVEGVPHSGDPATECFPPAILGLPREDELLGIDLTKFGVREAFLRVIATLLRLNLDDFISRAARERKRKAALFTSILALLIAAAVMLMPPPYDELYAEHVMESAVGAYVNAGSQYEALHNLTECALNNPAEFNDQLRLYKGIIPVTGMVSTKNSIQYLSDMMKTGKVMPWSREPMNQKECEELLALADSREGEYKLFASALEFVMTDYSAKRYYGSQYPKLLHDILEVDADIAAELYQIVCTPHLVGKYADNSTDAQGFSSLFASIPKQNKHLTGENVKQSQESLARLKGARDKCLVDIYSCGVLEAYRVKYGTKE